jgi:non-canonical poly(A) RNA polymerase PAPD5/7
MFGSLSTGLALESSDMDLVVTGLKIEGRDDVVDHIRALKDYFENHDFFTNVKAIEGASIPVIKLEADLQKIRESENSSNKSEVELSMRFLHIDITIEDSKEKKGDLFWEGIEWNEAKSHLGIKSIHLVKNYIKEYVHLKELTLCIKKLLAVKGLNSPYQGGLSSYGVVIMIVAYMNFFSLQNAWLNVSQLLIHFFEFYGSKFDERKVGIMVNRGG